MCYPISPIQSKKAPQTGFTLLEILITISIAAILLSVAIPAWQATVQHNRINNYSHTLFAQMQLARASAIATKTNRVFCPSADQQTCNDSPQWGAGWILFSDQDGDGELGDDDILERHQEATRNVLITSASSRTRIRFQPTGTTGGSNGTWIFCDTTKTAKPVAIILSRTGRARMSSTASDGSPLICPT